jgi:hypothetical protein
VVISVKGLIYKSLESNNLWNSDLLKPDRIITKFAIYTSWCLCGWFIGMSYTISNGNLWLREHIPLSFFLNHCLLVLIYSFYRFAIVSLFNKVLSISTVNLSDMYIFWMINYDKL